MKFSNWVRWKDRHSLSRLQHPGVYAIAITDIDLSNMKYDWIGEIVYFGMTNSRGGLKSRLRQFERTLKGKGGHGGAARVIFEHHSYDHLIPKLYLAVLPFECNVLSSNPTDLQIMGKVAKCEYDCIAAYVEKHGRLPQFNDKKLSPKK
ncbi:MAG: hypothetical protein KDB68_14590 [Planctomycetes bacterium]|nr:hypothetical protein [Planctomycetota bacterium]MCA8937424.1 hypothetical protein [Planctomycetota bacterium]